MVHPVQVSPISRWNQMTVYNVFVSVTINPTAAGVPFIVQDSILVSYNGNQQKIQLQAYGQNAIFLRNTRITRDSTWKNDLPFVILDKLTIDSNVTLTIQKGCKIYCHADAPVLVNGTLKINGEAATASRVIFAGDRLDPQYNGLPGSWPGIQFTSSSKNNVLNYVVIRDAFQGIVANEYVAGSFKVVLNQCIIFNVSDAGISSTTSSIKAVNCLIANCGSNISISGGGSYSFDQCTVATYGNVLINHQNPVLSVSNADTFSNTFRLDAQFRNCIFYGEGGLVENEILIDKRGSPAPADFNVIFANALYKNKDEPSDATFLNPLNNQPPEFDSIDVDKGYFDFHLKPTSPAVDAGVNTGIIIDLDGNSRDALPDLGCYEL